MGGSGSGDWYRYSKKPTEENFWRFSIGALKKHGLIGGGRRASGTWQWSRNGETCCSISYELNTIYAPGWLRVHYKNKSTDKDYDYKIYFSTTRPNYGGERWWFQCPAQGCGKRVGVLYLANIFACRHCCGLAYSSQNEAQHYRMLHKAQKIHRQLGGDGVVDDGLVKPKGMHWKTFNRKVEIMENANSASWLGAAARFGISNL